MLFLIRNENNIAGWSERESEREIEEAERKPNRIQRMRKHNKKRTTRKWLPIPGTHKMVKITEWWIMVNTRNTPFVYHTKCTCIYIIVHKLTEKIIVVPLEYVLMLSRNQQLATNKKWKELNRLERKYMWAVCDSLQNFTARRWKKHTRTHWERERENE